MSEPRIALTLRLSASLHDRVEAVAVQQDITLTDALRVAVVRYVREEECRLALCELEAA